MMSQLKQFVPSHVCLTCDGCCRFKSADSNWRPKLGNEEKALLSHHVAGNFSDDENYIKTIEECGNQLCRFFNKGDSTCQIYDKRPFECALYPFILSQEAGGIKVYVHLACPYVQDMQANPLLQEYIQYLKDFFTSPQTIDFLKRNKTLLHDYAPFLAELQYLFTISAIATLGTAPVALGTVANSAVRTVLGQELGAVPKQVSRVITLLANQDLFNNYLARENPLLSSTHFSALLAWSDFFAFTFEIINDRLCIFAHHEPGTFLYLPPLGGPVEQATLDQCIKRMGKTSIDRRVARIENLTLDQVNQLDPKIFESIKKSDEYLYRKEEIVALSGNAYKSQRHDINHLHKTQQVRYANYTEEYLTQCVDLYGRWAINRRSHSDDVIYQAMLEYNAIAHAAIFQHYEVLGIKGRVVLIDKQVVAYSFGYRLKADTFCVLLEVTDLKIVGLSAYIFNQFCADPCWQNLKFVNTMDDFGLPNLAEVKKGYRPVQLIPSYTIYPKR